MPFIQIKVKKGGIIETDYENFPNNMCNETEQEFLDRMKHVLSMEIKSEEPKEDELLQEETHYE